MPPRDDRGRFLRSLPGDDTFVTVDVTNKEIYDSIQELGGRVGRIETRLDRFHGVAALAVPTVTCLAGLVTSYYYLRGGK